jgi:hypothetical protein
MNYTHDSGFFMSFALILLTSGAIYLGYILQDLILAFGSEFWGNSILVLPSHNRYLDPFQSFSL